MRYNNQLSEKMKKHKWFLAFLVILLSACGTPAFVSSTNEEGSRFNDRTPVIQETLLIPDTGAIQQNQQDPESIPTLVLPVVPETCKPTYNLDFEKWAVTLINKYRLDNGLPLLVWNETLAAAGRDHSAEMACFRYASHTGLDGSGPGSRMLEQGYSWTYFGENIAGGYESVERAAAGWMSSPHHRANILNPKFTEIGVGYTKLDGSPYGWYWTADFAAP
jgi:uncharacterized protein YkwD